MWERRKILVIVSLLAFAALGWFFLREREPRYAGRSLSEWYALWSRSMGREDPESEAQAAAAAQAIRLIGTNAIPILLSRLKSEAALGRNPLVGLADRLPAPIVEKIIFPLFLQGNKAEPINTFVILGPVAAPAVPQLAAMMFATNDQQLAYIATYCLGAIGPAGLPPLLIALANTNLPCCYDAAYWLSTQAPFPFGTNIAQAVPLLARCTAATDPRLAKAAINALGHIAMEPQIAIPALTDCLNAPNPTIRRAAVHSLARFGKQTIPVLLTALNDSDQLVHNAAMNSLRILAPEALTNAPAPNPNP